VIVTGPSGVAVPMVENGSGPASTINALLDPARQLRYQRGGIEIETGFSVEIAYDRFKKLGNRTVVGRSPFFKLVLDQMSSTRWVTEVRFHPHPYPRSVSIWRRAPVVLDRYCDRW
jgi:hypothetical protein